MTLFVSGNSDAAHSRALTAVTDLADGVTAELPYRAVAYRLTRPN
jgi:hypothetical protein